MEKDAGRKAEMERGAQVIALRYLAKEFDPNYIDSYPNEGPTISPAERARRDEYHKHLGAWKRIHEPDNS